MKKVRKFLDNTELYMQPLNTMNRRLVSCFPCLVIQWTPFNEVIQDPIVSVVLHTNCPIFRGVWIALF